MKPQKILFLATLLVVSASASAQATPDSVVNMVTLAMKPAMATLTTTAIAWLGAFAMLQFFITNFGLLKSGADIEAVYGKLIGSLAWFGMCFYILMNGPDFIAKVGDSFFHMIGANLPSASDMILDALVLVGKMIVVSMVGAAIPFVGDTLGPLIVYVMIFNFAVSLFFAFKIFMIQLELGLIVMLSPLSFSMLGLNALKDQGIAPLKALISLAYRIILMTVIMGAYAKVSSAVGDEFVKFGSMGIKDFTTNSAISGLFKTVISAFGAYLVLAYFLWKSDSIAANMASGSTNMGTADIASAAAVGAAAGAAAGALATAGGATLGASKPGQLMSDVMKNLRAGNTQVSNGGGMGSGGGGSGAADAMPMASLGDAPQRTETPSSDLSTPPVRPENDKASGGSNPPNGDFLGGGKIAGINPQPGAPAPEQKQPPTESLGQRAMKAAGAFNQHVAQEKAATHGSINTHHSD